MKKYIAFILVFALCLSLCACSATNSTNAKPEQSGPITTVDIESYATVGRIPEYDVGLGGTMGDVRAQFLGSDSLIYEVLSDIHTLSFDSVTYYMDRQSYVVTGLLVKGAAFELQGTVTPEKMVELLGEPESAGVPDVSNVSLYENATGEEWMQVYKMGENTLVFYYLSGEYVGTLLYSTNSFTLIGE